MQPACFWTIIVVRMGYESKEGYKSLKENGQIPYIKPRTYEKWKRRSFKKDISKRENMVYNEEIISATDYNIISPLMYMKKMLY